MKSKKEKQKRLNRVIVASLVILSIGLIYAALCKKGLFIPCFFYKITGFMCPGCGNTRAALALLRLDFSAMLHYNFMFVFEILYLINVFTVSCIRYVKGKGFSYRPPCKVVDCIFLAALIIWTIVRNIFPIFSIG